MNKVRKTHCNCMYNYTYCKAWSNEEYVRIVVAIVIDVVVIIIISLGVDRRSTLANSDYFHFRHKIRGNKLNVWALGHLKKTLPYLLFFYCWQAGPPDFDGQALSQLKKMHYKALHFFKLSYNS